MAARVVLLLRTFSVSLSLALPSLSLPDLLPQSDGPNVRVHPREEASERRKIVKINELFFPGRPTDRPTDCPRGARSLAWSLPGFLR